jgi:archaeal flagellar protein FlaJ
MEIKISHWLGICIGAVFLIISLFFYSSNYFLILVFLGFLIISIPFVLTVIEENKINAEKEEMFMEFSRDLVEGVKTGATINKSIMNVYKKPYGALTENVKKLANQISLGIPLTQALNTFSEDVKNKTISRALTLIGQAEKAGGDIGEILEAVAKAVSTSDKLKRERKAAISTLVVQGYIIFIVFVLIVLIMQFKILPMVENISTQGLNLDEAGINSISGVGGEGEQISSKDLTTSFTVLLVIQGFFTGLVIGKLSEKNIKAGIKHSFFLVLISFSAAAISNLFL